MKLFKQFFVAATMILIAFSCTDMNDKHSIYLSQGETIYIGKVDSVLVFPGNNRVKLRFWASDPRAKSVGFYWTPFKDSLFIDIDKTASTDSFEIVIGGAESDKIIREGSYTLKVFTYDGKGHQSIPFERIIRVYGEKYQNSLPNRALISSTLLAVSGELILKFGQPINTEDIGVVVDYTDKSGEKLRAQFLNEDLGSTVSIPDIDDFEDVFYRTLFIPHPLAIDTFMSVPKPIAIY